MSKSFSKQYLCCSNAIVRFNPYLLVAILLIGYSAAYTAVPLENWRMRFFTIASEYEAAAASPSRMFWDGIDTMALFGTLFRAEDSSATSHWVFEPALAYGTDSQRGENTERYYHGELFNEFRWLNCSARHLLHVDSRYENDPYYPAHSQRALRGRIEEATFTATWKYGFFRLGRQQRNWGPFPDRSLIVSSNPYSYDAVETALFSRYFEFRHLFAPLPPERTQVDSDAGATYNRFLTAHSLNLIFGTWGTVGFTETVLFTRAASFPDLQYLNPFSIYSVINTNWEGGGNLMLGMQWSVHPGYEPVTLRGQIVLDDFQVDDEIATDKEPAHWGIDAGIYWRDPVFALPWRHGVKLEWRSGSPWLYTVPDENAARAERYIYYRKSIGYCENDFSTLRAGLSIVPSASSAGTFAVSYSRKGANTPLSQWNDAKAIPGLPVETYFPVIKRVAVEGAFLYSYKRMADVALDGSLGWEKNGDNIHTKHYAFDPSIGVELSLHYSDLLAVLPK